MALDRDDFQRLFEAEREHVYRLLYRLARHAADADDLLQETFLAAWRHREAYDGRGAAGGWLMSIAYRLWLDGLRKGSRRRALAAQAPGRSEVGPEPDHGRAESNGRAASQVRAAIEQLPEGVREACVLFHVAGLSVREVAEVLGLSPKTTQARLRRALDLLGRHLTPLRRQLPIA